MRTRLTSMFSLGLVAVIAVAACGKKASGGEAVTVTEIDLGRTLNQDLTIGDKTNTFRPADVIYASIETKGSGPATLAVRWTTQDNQVVDESSRTIAPSGREPARTEFHISKPDGWPMGKYRLAVMLNGTNAGTEEFEVKP
jgi:hypothetical protein